MSDLMLLVSALTILSTLSLNHLFQYLLGAYNMYLPRSQESNPEKGSLPPVEYEQLASGNTTFERYGTSGPHLRFPNSFQR